MMIGTFHPLLEGAFELHLHGSPSLSPQKQSDLDLVADMKRAGLAGLILKADEVESIQRAAMIRKIDPELHIYGEFVCNHYAGGLNPESVERAIHQGAKIISMPSLSAKNHQRYFSGENHHIYNRKKMAVLNNGIGLLDENMCLLPEVHQILSLIAKADITLATGHLGADEIKALVDAAVQYKVNKILVQQTDLGISQLSFEDEIELARRGCLIEKNYLACSEDYKTLTLREMAKRMKILGADSCVMVTNYGQLHNVNPVDAMNLFVEDMLHVGISRKDIQKMIVDNPRMLLGLSTPTMTFKLDMSKSHRAVHFIKKAS